VAGDAVQCPRILVVHLAPHQTPRRGELVLLGGDSGVFSEAGGCNIVSFMPSGLVMSTYATYDERVAAIYSGQAVDPVGKVYL